MELIIIKFFPVSCQFLLQTPQYPTQHPSVQQPQTVSPSVQETKFQTRTKQQAELKLNEVHERLREVSTSCLAELYINSPLRTVRLPLQAATELAVRRSQDIPSSSFCPSLSCLLAPFGPWTSKSFPSTPPLP